MCLCICVDVCGCFGLFLSLIRHSDGDSLFLITSTMIITLFDCLFFQRVSTAFAHRNKGNFGHSSHSNHPHTHSSSLRWWTTDHLSAWGWHKEGWTDRDRCWKGVKEMNGDRDRKWLSDKGDGGSFNLIIHLRLLSMVWKQGLMTCESPNIVFPCSIYWFWVYLLMKHCLPEHVQAILLGLPLWKISQMWRMFGSLPFQPSVFAQRKMSAMLQQIRYWFLRSVFPSMYIMW